MRWRGRQNWVLCYMSEGNTWLLRQASLRRGSYYSELLFTLMWPALSQRFFFCLTLKPRNKAKSFHSQQNKTCSFEEDTCFQNESLFLLSCAAWQQRTAPLHHPFVLSEQKHILPESSGRPLGIGGVLQGQLGQQCSLLWRILSGTLGGLNADIKTWEFSSKMK